MKQTLLNITMGQLLEDAAIKYSHINAVKYIECDYTRTYYEFNKEVDTIAQGLLGMGFKKGDHIAIWATNYPQWLILLFATSKIGVVLVTVNTNYKQSEIEYLLRQSDSKALFVCNGIKDIDCQKIIYSLCPELKTCKKGELECASLPKLKILVSIDGHYSGMFNWNEIVSFGCLVSQDDYQFAKSQCKPDDVINIQYTSGTTGFPKGVMLTHFNIINNAKAIGGRLNFTEKDRLCIPVPFFHVFGIVVAILACVTHGSTMIPLLYYSPLKVMHAVEYEKCTALHGVPTMFINVLSHRDFDKYNFSTLRAGVMAGSPCPQSVMQQVVDKMNMCDITSLYGQTEASPACTQCLCSDSIERKVSTVGCQMDHVETKIIDPHTGKDVPDGVSGEFVSRGYHIMKGYYNDIEATNNAIDKDGWLHTGDLAVRGSDGYYKITGRIKDMIIRGGENIFPKEIEDFLYTNPKIKDIQLVSVPSQKYGEEAFAFCILKAGCKANEKEIKEYVAKSLARHKIPSYVHFVDSFPMTASGKIQKFKLREQAIEILNLKNEDDFVFVNND
ncbi:MAG: AMP-binding protein [Clostridiales bacterium]|jgi:fatty-acyl-CoA synthase|nr:AMP-binding protein [Clostridiales bacterium]